MQLRRGLIQGRLSLFVTVCRGHDEADVVVAQRRRGNPLAGLGVEWNGGDARVLQEGRRVAEAAEGAVPFGVDADLTGKAPAPGPGVDLAAQLQVEFDGAEVEAEGPFDRIEASPRDDGCTEPRSLMSRS